MTWRTRAEALERNAAAAEARGDTETAEWLRKRAAGLRALEGA